MDVCIFYIQKHSLLRSLEDTVLGRGESGVKATNMGISSPASSLIWCWSVMRCIMLA